MEGKRRNLRKKNPAVSEVAVELNVMPFIDIFSLLCTFLLFSAVFISIGILEVQIPFLSQAADPKVQAAKRELTIKVEVSEKSIVLSSQFTRPPLAEETRTFARNQEGLRDFHQHLVKLKIEQKSSEKVTFFADEQLNYADLIEVLDQIKWRLPSDPLPMGDSKSEGNAATLYPKVVMGDVIL